MTLASTTARSANLTPMPEVENQESKERISPIGQSIDEFINYKSNSIQSQERTRTQPSAAGLSRMLMIRRIELDLSQQELADRMGTTVAVISRLELGSHNFSPTTLKRLAEALDTELVYAFEPVDDDNGLEYVYSFVVVP